jgi:outer membrane lipoprotein SlyB
LGYVGALAGAVVGAVVGALMGAVVGALMGAVVGAVVGALVGYVMNKKDRKIYCNSNYIIHINFIFINIKFNKI